MPIGIRSRLILAFIIITLLPLGLVFGSLLVSSSRLSESANQEQAAAIQEASEAVSRQVMNSFGSIDDYDQFDAEMQPVLDQYRLNLRITGNSQELLYDSQDRAGSLEHKIAQIGPFERLGFQSLSTGSVYTFGFPIVLNSQTVARATVSADATTAPFSLARKFVMSIVLSLGLGFFSLLILILLFTWYISRTVVKPLHKLSIAAEKIAQGDLDFTVTYAKNDEFGRFSKTFDLMRSQLRESLVRERASERARIEMIASISHDLRTPISSVKGYVEGLLDGVTTDKDMFERYLGVIKGKTEQLDRLIEDLLQFSQLELGRLELKEVSMDSRELLAEILGDLELEFSQSPVRLTVIQPIPSVQIKADGQRIQQVISNLVENARRYAGPDAAIEIRSFLRDHQLVVEVQDNGPGIAAEDLPHIFNRFYRGEKSRSREYGGTGLGLAICKQLVEAHGGQIWVESTPGRGSVFSFSIPCISTTVCNY